MEPAIRYIRFYNGQFLREEEFNEEQVYTLHMRRRINYALFDNGVVQITPDDMTVVLADPPVPGTKRIRIRRGMAIGSNHVVMEAREIILREDSPAFDLQTEGFSDGDTVWVTVNYRLSLTGTDDSRVEETPEIRFHTSDPGALLTADDDPFIVLGTVAFTTMQIDHATGRQTARLRSSLLGGGGGGGGGGGATLVSIALTPAGPLAMTAGGTQSLSAEGTFSDASTAALTSADGLTWGSSDVGIATVSAAGLVTAVAPGTATITASVGTVTQSVDVTVSAAAPVPTIASITPDRQAAGGLVEVFGQQIRDASLANNVAAVGTTIRLFSGANSKDAINVTTRPTNLVTGNQSVRFTMPDRTGTPWGPQEIVTLELTFQGATVSAPYRYDD